MRAFTVGLMQFCCQTEYEKNLLRIEQNVSDLMRQINPPDLIIGPELGLGVVGQDGKRQDLSGPLMQSLSEIAVRYQVYLAPGTFFESTIENGKKTLHNTLPIFNPKGELIDVYRKICPYYPMEQRVTPGDRYCVLHIPEKDVKIGFMICHDWCFPEISRNLTLLGAEMLIRVAMDEEGLRDNCRHIAEVRAFENQAYFISLNQAGTWNGTHSYGRSVIAGPDGKEIYEGGEGEFNVCLTYDMDEVKRVRTYGTNFTDQLIRQLQVFHFPEPFSGDQGQAPVFADLPKTELTMAEYREHSIENRIAQKRK